MPNVYSSDIYDDTLRQEDLHSGGAYARCLEVQETGNTAFVALCCGFWFEWSLALGELFFGIDIKNRRAVFFDDGKAKLTTSTWPQCGKAVAGLLALPEGEIAKRFKNGPLYVGSFTVSQRQMLDAVHRVLGTGDGDWEIRYENSTERYQEGLEQMKGGDRLGFPKALYTRAFFPNAPGDFETSRGLHNEVVGLKKEDLDEAVKRTVEMVESGWTPGGEYKAFFAK